MSLESEYRFVSKMFGLAIKFAIARAISIVETWVLLRCLHVSELVIRDGLTYVPDLEQLIFTIGGKVDSITFTGYISDAFSVTDENTSWSVRVEGTSIPNLDHTIVATGEDNV